MGKAGGIIGLLAGLFGTGAAIITLFFGGLGAAIGVQEGDTVIGLGWGGLFFSFLVIIFGIVAIFNHGVGGYGLIASSIIGAILGGTIVAVCMVMSLIGGVLAVVESRKKQVAPMPTKEHEPTQVSTTDTKKGQLKRIIGGAIAGLIIIGGFIGMMGTEYSSKPKKDPIAELAATEPLNLDPSGELADIFAIGSKYTDLQRENKLKEIKGKVVQWTLPVYEIKKIKENKYRVQTESNVDLGLWGKKTVGAFINITTRTDEERAFIESLKTKDKITFKGVIAGTTLRSFDIEPAIVVLEEKIKAPITAHHSTQQGQGFIDPMPYLGKHPLEFLKNPNVRQHFIEQIGNKEDFDLLYANLQGSSVLKELTVGDDIWYYADSSTQRNGRPEGAAFMINANNGYVFGVIRTNTHQGGILKLIGVQNPKELQSPLYKWYKEQGGID